MSVSITLDVEHNVIADDNALTYKVTCTVPATEGIDLALFVYTVTTEVYSHPATVRDLEFFPASRNDSINQGLDYYRLSTVIKIFDSMSDALAFDRLVRSRMQQLANDLPQTQDNLFTGPQTYTFVTAES